MSEEVLILPEKGQVIKQTMLRYIKGIITREELPYKGLLKYVQTQHDASMVISVLYRFYAGKITVDTPNYQLRRQGLDVRIVRETMKLLI